MPGDLEASLGQGAKGHYYYLITGRAISLIFFSGFPEGKS
jgi:hypothetical protein